MSEAQRAAQALQAGRRMIARGERPLYRLAIATDGRLAVENAPWLPLVATHRRDALAEARAAIADWLDVAPDAFELEIGG